MKTKKLLSGLIVVAGLFGMAGLAQAEESPVGVWTLSWSWGCTNLYHTTPLYVYADGRFGLSSGSISGTWWQNHSTFTFTFTNGTTYTGSHVNRSMTGVQRGHNNDDGCWYAHPGNGTLSLSAQSLRGGKGPDGE